MHLYLTATANNTNHFMSWEQRIAYGKLKSASLKTRYLAMGPPEAVNSGQRSVLDSVEMERHEIGYRSIASAINRFPRVCIMLTASDISPHT